MENNVRFRNHISIVFENLGRMIFFVLVMVIGGVAQNAGELMESEGITAGDVRIILMGSAGGLALLLVITIWQVIVWAKTYISVQDNTIVIERNTLNRKKNTIGVKNISNVNTEQNLFEMLLGTSKVKLDTNSLSTADQTDVKIVLKKKEAEAFREYIMRFLETGEKKENVSAGGRHGETAAKKFHYEFQSELQDILVHGAFSISIFSLLVLVGGVVGLVEVIMRIMDQTVIVRSVFHILASSLVAIMFVCSAFWDIMKGFVKYYDFKVARGQDKLYIQYGVLKKVSYTIPVDKINGVKLTQSPLARLTGRYMAEIINVGMGDDETEKKSFLILYCKKEVLEDRLCRLLPEMASSIRFQIPRQPKGMWAANIPALLLWFLIIGGSAGISINYLPEYRKWIVLGTVGLLFLIVVLMIFWYLTAGCEMMKEGIAISTGYVGRRLTFLNYDRIQHVELKQNFIARKVRVLKGNVHLLASAANKVQSLPYFQEKYVDTIKMNMLS